MITVPGFPALQYHGVPPNWGMVGDESGGPGLNRTQNTSEHGNTLLRAWSSCPTMGGRSGTRRGVKTVAWWRCARSVRYRDGLWEAFPHSLRASKCARLLEATGALKAHGMGVSEKAIRGLDRPGDLEAERSCAQCKLSRAALS